MRDGTIWVSDGMATYFVLRGLQCRHNLMTK